MILMKKYIIWSRNPALLLLKKRTLFSKIPAVSAHESKLVSCSSQLWKRLYKKPTRLKAISWSILRRLWKVRNFLKCMNLRKTCRHKGPFSYYVFNRCCQVIRVWSWKVKTYGYFGSCSLDSTFNFESMNPNFLTLYNHWA